MKLVFLCVASALALRDVDPPVISLTLPYTWQHSVQTHVNTPNVTLNAANVARHVHDASSNSVTCEVGTSQADVDVCPKPTCQAYDHHEGNIACTTTYILVNNDNTPTTSQTPTADIERGLRSEWLLKYDATDQSGNKAQTVSFTMIFQDTRTPDLETEFKNTSWEHDESHALDANGVGSRLETNTFTVQDVGTHPWLQACFGYSKAEEKSSYAAQCKYALSRVVNATDEYDGDVTNKVEARMCYHTSANNAATQGCESISSWETLSAAVPAADDWTVDSHFIDSERVYVVEYKACDNAGIFGYDEKENCGVQRNVIKISDTVIPEIYRNTYNTAGNVSCSEDTCTVECRKDNSWYVEPGAQCYDARESWTVDSDTPLDKDATVTYTLDGATNKEGATNAALNTKQNDATTRIGYSLFPKCNGANPACEAEDATESSANQYIVHYNCNDGVPPGNKANEVLRTLNVQDTEKPTIHLPSPHEIENSAGSHVFNSSHGFEVSAGLNMGYLGTGGLGDVNDASVVSCSDTCDRDVFITATLHEGLTCADDKIVAKGTDKEGRLLENWDDYKVGDYSIKYSCYDHFRRDLITHHQGVVPEKGTTSTEYKNDAAGRTSMSDTVCRKIRNVDHTHPIIQILGSDTMTLEATQEGNYVDDGATCSDQVDGVISQHVEVSGDVVNLAKVGVYTVTYHCKDSAGNAAPHISRTVTVEHTTCPRCTVHGCGTSTDGCSVTHEASFPYVDPGASCTDDIDGDIKEFSKSGLQSAACQWQACSSDATGVDTETTGTYRITYRAKNSNGLWNDDKQDDGVTDAVAPKSCAGHSDHHGAKSYFRTVKVKDTLKPQMRITYGADEEVVALSSDTDTSTAWITNASTAAPVANINKESPYKTDSIDNGPQYFDSGSQDAFSLMAEGAQGASTAWLLAAVGAAVAGIALLGMSQRRATTSVPV